MNSLIEALDRACPGFVPNELQVDIQYSWISGFVRHVIDAHIAGRRTEVQAAFDVIEAEIASGGPHAELAIVGFLEDLQNLNLHKRGTTRDDFLPYLGPAAFRSWSGLIEFWEGSKTRH